MSRTENQQIETDCPLEDAFAVYCDISRWRNRSVFGNIRWTHGEPWRVGSRLEYEMSFPGFLKVRQLVSEFERNKRVGYITHASGITLHSTVDFTALPRQRTRIEVSVDSAGITTTLFGFAIDAVIEKTLTKFLADLKNDCENYAASQRSG